MDTLHPLKQARHERALSLQDLARRTGLDRRRIIDWEAGRHIPNDLSAHILAPALGFSSGAHIQDACRDWNREHP